MGFEMDQHILDSIDDLGDIKKVARSVGRSARSMRNRLCSIIYDNEFVTTQVEPLYKHRPLIPNMRCGLWYVRPEQRGLVCYFKSTDGHNTQWDFSIKRLNFHLIPIIMANNGIVIVDSTRRGKKMPDLLSKTIPIWCCCINAVIFGDIQLNLPPGTVSKLEYDMILQKIPIFVLKIKELKLLDEVELDKPLRPIWCYPGSVPYEPLEECTDFHPIVCCTASMQYQDGELHLKEFEYVQGAADDHELWAPDPDFDDEIFWGNALHFLNLTNDDEINQFVSTLVEEHKSKERFIDVDDIISFPKTNYSNGRVVKKIDRMPVLFEKYEKVVIFTETFKTDFLEHFNCTTTTTAANNKIIYFPFSSNKKFYKKFRDNLLNLIKTLEKIEGDILVLCENGQDFSIGVVLCLICCKYDLNWDVSKQNLVTKNFIKLQLINMMKVRQFNVQRNILNSCNSVLM